MRGVLATLRALVWSAARTVAVPIAGAWLDRAVAGAEARDEIELATWPHQPAHPGDAFDSSS